MARVKAKINPALLVWAREEAGLSLSAAAKKLKVDEDKLRAWEAGDDSPSVSKLRDVASAYKRPLAAFYLRERPKDFRVVQTDFRRHPGEVAGIYSPELRLDLRDAAYHREVALDLFAEIGEKPPDPIAELRATINDDPDELARRIRSFLGVDAVPRGARDGFSYWRALIEAKGILVFQATRVSTKEMRGYSQAIEPLPIIVVNRRESRSARLFSIAHEFAHIVLRRSGLCDIEEAAPRPPEEQSVEIFCNRVAGAALVPRESLLNHWVVRENPTVVRWSSDQLQQIATAHHGVSREVVLRRLLIAGRTTVSYYEQMRKSFAQEYEEREAAAAAEASRKERKRNVPTETIGMLGRPFVSLVLEGYDSDRITLNDVSTYLGVRVKHIGRIQRLVGSGG